MSSLKEKITRTLLLLEKEVETVLSIALESNTKENNLNWNSVLNNLNITPLTNEEKIHRLRNGIPNSKGALPIEVRWCLEKLTNKYQIIANDFKSELNPKDLDWDSEELLEKLELKIQNLVETQIQIYISKSKPGLAISNIFANAQKTTTKFEKINSSIETKVCKCCGAPRVENSDLKFCSFCGNNFFKN